jgi:energy-coupling factor transport system permease protein
MYVPGTSWLHRLDSRAKLWMVFMVSILLFSVNSSVMLAVVLGSVIAGFVFAQIPLRSVRTVVSPVLFIGAVTFIANAIAWRGISVDMTLLGVGISFAGIAHGLYFLLRLLAIVLETALVTLTTSPVALTDAITSMLSPLRLLRVPVDDVALVFSIALRFIPTIADETERIVTAQTARGAQFESGGIVVRIRAWIPVLVPLLVQLFRRADNLALAMESRCYIGQGRTRLRELRWRGSDTASVGLVMVLCATMWVLSFKGVL